MIRQSIIQFFCINPILPNNGKKNPTIGLKLLSLTCYWAHYHSVPGLEHIPVHLMNYASCKCKELNFGHAGISSSTPLISDHAGMAHKHIALLATSLAARVLRETVGGTKGSSRLRRMRLVVVPACVCVFIVRERVFIAGHD